jgi:hypothetical protein
MLSPAARVANARPVSRARPAAVQVKAAAMKVRPGLIGCRRGACNGGCRWPRMLRSPAQRLWLAFHTKGSCRKKHGRLRRPTRPGRGHRCWRPHGRARSEAAGGCGRGQVPARPHRPRHHGAQQGQRRTRTRDPVAAWPGLGRAATARPLRGRMYAAAWPSLGNRSVPRAPILGPPFPTSYHRSPPPPPTCHRAPRR